MHTKTKILSDEAGKECRRIQHHKDISAHLYRRRKQYLTDDSSYGNTIVKHRPGHRYLSITRQFANYLTQLLTRDNLDVEINHFYDEVIQDLDTRLKKCINEVVRLNDQISNTNRYVDNVSGISITQNAQSTIGPSQIKNLLRQQQQLFQIIGNEIAVNNSNIEVCKNKFLSHNTYKKYHDIFNKQKKSEWDLNEEKNMVQDSSNGVNNAQAQPPANPVFGNGGMAAPNNLFGNPGPGFGNGVNIAPVQPGQFGNGGMPAQNNPFVNPGFVAPVQPAANNPGFGMGMPAQNNPFGNPGFGNGVNIAPVQPAANNPGFGMGVPAQNNAFGNPGFGNGVNIAPVQPAANNPVFGMGMPAQNNPFGNLNNAGFGNGFNMQQAGMFGKAKEAPH